MSQRFSMALACLEQSNLIELARSLAVATTEAFAENAIPHLDPAVRLISFQIALAGNGDMHDRNGYQKLYDYCVLKQAGAPNYEVIGAPAPEVPKYEAN